MTILVSNTADDDTFRYWKTRTNELAEALTNSILTVDSNTTVGNVMVDGTMTIGNSTVNSIANSSTITSQHFDNVSDRNLKEDIFTIDNSHIVLELNPVSFHWKNDHAKVLNHGFIAQEVELIYPELVTTTHGQKSVSYIQMIPLLLAQIQKQQKQIDELERRCNGAFSW